ncbi:Metallo-hydrolase/oxidoreductase [Atractiella rhizophila]|nr:Metallo-hydrolase/oxidoreductase [Atractiella rhizophila]
MKVVPVPCRSDNYAYLLIDEPTKKAAAIDPYDVKKVVETAEKEGVTLGELVITTHHHQDHSGGNVEFKEKYPSAEIRGGSDKCPGMTKQSKDGETFKFGEHITIKALGTPCHTQDSICYFVEDPFTKQRGVFTGDTLFVAGCGRYFEGTGEEMHRALNGVLGDLPGDTLTYVGHEYTASNARFAASVEPDNEDLKKLIKFAEDNQVTTGKFTIADEKKFNPFMRLSNPAVLKATKKSGMVEVIDELRTMKNNFRG